jgi:hypothetical protein
LTRWKPWHEDRQQRPANWHRLVAEASDRLARHHRRAPEAQLRDNLRAVGWSLDPALIAALSRASDVMPAYPYYPYRTQQGFARLNPPLV